MISVRALLLGGLIVLAACVPEPAKPPTPPPQPRPVAPAPLPTPVPPPPQWSDLPLTPGTWSYRDEPARSEAVFGSPAAGTAFIVRCDKTMRRITLARLGVTTGNTMTIRTSSDRRNLPLSVEAGPNAIPFSSVGASDPLLDSMAFSRGRITVEVPGMPMLVVPAWPDAGRVIEDCRG